MLIPAIWTSQSVKRHLEPLAIAARITQSNTCRLDEVLLTFGDIYQNFSRFSDPEDVHVCEAVLKSLETRWGKADQDVFIAAIILNPYLQSNPFSQSTLLYAPAFLADLLG